MANPSWFEHVDLMQVVIVGCFAFFAWVFKRGVDRWVKALDRLGDHISSVDNRLSRLEGEHDSLTCLAPRFGRRASDLQYPRDGIPHNLGESG